MPKLSKVQKKVAKKRRDNTNSLHENSRDAMKLRRAAGRAEKLEKLAGARNKAKNPHRTRMIAYDFGEDVFSSLLTDGLGVRISSESGVLQGSGEGC